VIRWLAGRLLQALATYVLAVTLLFVLMRLTPGDPLSRLSDERPLPPEAREVLRRRYRLDQPILTQYADFLGGALHGELGVSIAQHGRPVTALIAERLPATLLLGTATLVAMFGIGIAVGVLQATRAGSLTDRVLGIVSLTAYATPSFWLGLVLTWALATERHWFPVAFMHAPLLDPDAGWWVRTVDLTWHLALPVTTLTLVSFGAVARYQRTAMLEALALDAVRTARTKGLRDQRILWRHAWRNSVGPMLALFGLWLPLVVAGSVFVESVFAWPGLGTLAAESIGGRDYPVIMGVAILVSGVVIGGNLLADLLHGWLDPRLRPSE
jgi:peptide/nickel transport system permease protein